MEVVTVLVSSSDNVSELDSQSAWFEYWSDLFLCNSSVFRDERRDSSPLK
jgi:hypothetical protein